MKVLITGATGFIGGRIAADLLARGGYEVYFSGRSQPRDCSLEERGARFVRGDLGDREFCARAARGMDAVIHCAGLAGVWGSYETYRLANVVATENLVQVSRQAGVKRFVNISSPSIYFEFRDQFDLVESYVPKKFSNAYARTKWEAEQIVQRAHAPEFLTVSLRPRGVIGAGDQNILPRFIRLKQKGGLVQVGSGQNIVDFTTIGNLLEAIVLCLTAPPAAMGDVYNISNGAPIKLWDFAEMVLRKAGYSSERRRVPYAPVMAIATLNECLSRAVGRQSEPVFLPITIGIATFSMTLDITKARAKLGYAPRLTTEAGIDEFVATLPRS